VRRQIQPLPEHDQTSRRSNPGPTKPTSTSSSWARACPESGSLARRVLTMPPAKAGEIIVRAAERRAPRVVIGHRAKMMALIERLAPVSYWKILGPLAPRPRAAPSEDQEDIYDNHHRRHSAAGGPEPKLGSVPNNFSQ
jgi:hypothetical protein